MTGLRTAAVQVVATAGLAALVGGGGLGRIVNLGFGQQNYGLIIAGAILIAALALLTELLLVVLTWAVTPDPAAFPSCGPGPPVSRQSPAGGRGHAPLSWRITNPQQRGPRCIVRNREGLHVACGAPARHAWRHGRTGHRRRASMRARITVDRTPLAMAVALTAACGSSGSSGTGGASASSGNAAGGACAPLPVTSSSSSRTTSTCRTPTTSSRPSMPRPRRAARAAAGTERGVGQAHDQGPRRHERRGGRRPQERAEVAAAWVDKAA